jgi:hypothetical protein
MAPEQLVGAPATARTDQFAFAVALWEALHGSFPFGGDTIPERTRNILDARFLEAPQQPRLPGASRRALLKALGGEPEQRFESMSALLTALERPLERRGRTALWIGLAAGAAALASLAIGLQRRPEVKLCRGADDAIAPAWSAARARDVERAFGASGNARAQEVLASVLPSLDVYARKWAATQTEACEATRVRGVQSEEALDLRMECLRQRERELAATVDLFAAADSALVDRAVRIVSDLTPVSSCADPAALRAPFAPPRDDAQRRDVDELRHTMARIDALHLAGHFEEGFALAEESLQHASAVGYDPIRVEALWRRAFFASVLAKPEASGWELDAAIEADAAKVDVLAVRGWTQLAYEANDSGKQEDARTWARIADARLRRMPPDEALRARLLHVEARLAYDRGDKAGSLAMARESLVLFERTLGEHATPTMEARADAADALAGMGDLSGSLADNRALYDAQVATLGAAHPATLWTLVTVGDTLVDLGRDAEGLATIDRAYAERARMEPRGLSWCLFARSKALVHTGRIQEGLALFEGSDPPPNPSSLAEEEGDIAFSLAVRGDVRDAITYANRALSRLQKVEHDPEAVTNALAARALVEARRGDGKAALSDADAAVASVGATPSELEQIIPRLARGEALLALGRTGDARVDLDRAKAATATTEGDAAVREELNAALARATTAAAR